MASILGLDIAEKSMVSHLEVGDSTYSRSWKNTPAGTRSLCKWLGHQGVTELRACMEATSVYHLIVATALYEADHRVHVANPWAVKQFAKSLMKRTKTDKTDAEVITRYCEANRNLHEWKPLPPERAELTRLTRHRENLKVQRGTLKNRQGTEASHTVQASLARQLEFLSAEIVAVDQAIKAHLETHPYLAEANAHLQTIPGIGPVTSAVILSELGNYERFDDPRQVAAYAGLSPEAHQSGSSIQGREELSKLGNARLRNAMYLPAVVAFRMKILFPDLIKRLTDQCRPKMIIIGALMRKLLCLAYGVLRSNLPYDPEYATKHATMKYPEGAQ
jgi:transposase